MKSIRPLPRRALRKWEVAQILGISNPIVDRLIAAGQLRAIKPTPNSVRVLPEDLEIFIANHATIPARPAYATV
jgi:excisionase family DNA binding protein